MLIKVKKSFLSEYLIGIIKSDNKKMVHNLNFYIFAVVRKPVLLGDKSKQIASVLMTSLVSDGLGKLHQFYPF